MAAPLVSVLITTYNRARTLARSIRSVLVQSFQDFELIIVDDASTDDTASVLAAWEGHPKIRICSNPANLGDFPNRNHAASLARGRYLKYVDSDDLIYPHALACMIAALEAAPAAGLALSGKTPPDWPTPCSLRPEAAYLWQALGPGRILGGNGPTFTCLRRSVFEATDGFPDLKGMGDHALWMRMAAIADVVFLPGGLASSALSPLSETTHPFSMSPKGHASRFRMLMDALAAPACPLPPELARHLARRAGDLYAADLARLAWQRRAPVAFSVRTLRDANLGPGAIVRGVLRKNPVRTLPDPEPVPLAPPPGFAAAPPPGPPSVTVILTAGPRAGATAASVRSILDQTLRDVELLILGADVEAGADDLPVDPRVRRAPPEMAADETRVAAARSAAAPWLIFLAAGDILQPHGIAVLRGALSRYPAADLAVSMQGSRRLVLPMLFAPGTANLMEAQPRHRLLTHAVPAVCVRRDAFVSAGGVKGRRTGDQVNTWLRVAAAGAVVAVPAGLGRGFKDRAAARRGRWRHREKPIIWKPGAHQDPAAAEPDWAAFPGARLDLLEPTRPTMPAAP